MLLFWLLCILLLIIASLALIVPVLKNRQMIEADRDSLNKTLYQSRVKEIAQDVDQGLVAEQAAVLTELQHNLLEDVVEAKPVKRNVSLALILLPGVVLFFAICIGLYLQFGASKQVTHWQEVVANYETLQQKMSMADGQPPSKQEVDDFILALRTHLANEPSDAQGWLMLGRLAFALRDAELAEGALEKAYELAPTDAAISVAYAQSLLQSEDPEQIQQAQQLIVNIIKQDPTNIQALSAYAFMALQQEDFAAAIARWENMLPLLEAGGERYTMVESSIAYAKQQLANPDTKSNDVVAETVDEAPAIAEIPVEPVTIAPAVESNEEVATAAAYSVQISLGDNVVLPDSGYLFVFAQMVNGPPMPLAAKKLPLTSFPLTVSLSDSDSMVAGLTLSQQTEFVFKARISLNEDVASGQWQGESGVIKAGHSEIIDVVIDNKI